MPVVSIKDRNNPKLEKKRVMELVHNATGVYFTGFRNNQIGYSAHLETNEDKAKLLDPAIREELSKEGVEIMKPPDYRAACTFIMRHGDQIYDGLGESGCKEAIEKSIKCKIIQMSLSGDRLRIELNSPEDAKRVLERDEGISTENYMYNPGDLEPQRYFKIPQCSRCFSYAHERPDCPSREQLCFICAEPGHDDVSCPRKDNPRCRNCHQDHVAIAFKCPFRKVRLVELGERHDCDLDSLIIVHRMRQVLGEKGPDDSSDEEEDNDEDASSETRSEDTVEGAGAIAPPHDDSEAEEMATRESRDLQEEKIRNQLANFLGHFRDVCQTFIDQHKEKFGSPDPNIRGGEEWWRTSRVLKAPDPEKGEGPPRNFRKIENFVAPASPKNFTKIEFPIIPKRPLRRVQNVG